MKLAVSSLAWEPDDDAAVRAELVRLGVRAIELAPMKHWPAAPAVATRELARYRALWDDAGISIVALQGILFGQPSLQLFGSASQRDAFATHMLGMTDIAQALGAGIVVLGAPKNRLRGELSMDEAIHASVPVLRRIAEAAADRDCVVCIEPNPPLYGGDFVCTIAEAIRLVDLVNHPGFGLHLDAGAVAINGEPDSEILAALPRARHFHMSEIGLAPLGAGTVAHQHLGDLVRRTHYDQWLSVEMAPLDRATLLSTLAGSVEFARSAYR